MIEGNKLTSSTTPASSPTGTPVVPVSAVPWIAAAFAVCEALAASVPSHTLLGRGLAVLLHAAPIIGMLLPGWRK